MKLTIRCILVGVLLLALTGLAYAETSVKTPCRQAADEMTDDDYSILSEIGMPFLENEDVCRSGSSSVINTKYGDLVCETNRNSGVVAKFVFKDEVAKRFPYLLGIILVDTAELDNGYRHIGREFRIVCLANKTETYIVSSYSSLSP